MRIMCTCSACCTPGKPLAVSALAAVAQEGALYEVVRKLGRQNVLLRLTTSPQARNR